MKIRTLAALCLCATPAAAAEDFTPPKAHPVERYRAGWTKNPFTLKTAPPTMTKESFAKDLALAGWRLAGDDTIVILVNTRTKEYTRLKNNDATPDGIKVKQTDLQDRRADTFVVLEKGGDTAVVRYNESFLKGAAAQQAQGVAGQNQPGMQFTQQPGVGMVQNRVGAAGGAMGNQPALAANGQPLPPAAGMPATVAPPLPGVSGGVQPTTAGQQSSIPTVQRRRMQTAPQPQVPR